MFTERELSYCKNIMISKFQYINDDSGKILILHKESDYKFNLNRLFLIFEDKGSKRGMHAHKRCFQFLICIEGKVELVVDDGSVTKELLLDSPDKGVLIPPSIWAVQSYLAKSNKLLVLCSDIFDESDYIRSYNEFLKFRSSCK